LVNLDQETLDLAQAIEAYLAAHPAAADTVEGIARFWLSPAAAPRSLLMVQRALDLLARDQRVVTCKRTGGLALYRAAQARSAD
jgi:hypothetical protein